MSPSNRDAEAREARRRARNWTAKQQVNEELAARKRRDNVISSLVLVVGVAVVVFLTVTYFTAGPGSVTASSSASATAQAASSSAASPTGSAAATANSGDVPSPSLAEGRTWTGSISLNGKPVEISLDGAAAPQAVASFVSLAKKGFFNNVTCHRLVDQTNFHILQCGDPTGTGTGGPGYSFGPIENAPSDNIYSKGTIAMARQGGAAYSMGSQFFFVFGDSTIPADAAGGYTVFGSVTNGLDVLTNIAAAGANSSTSAPTNTVTMTNITVE